MMQLDHLDGDPRNNAPDNLRCVRSPSAREMSRAAYAEASLDAAERHGKAMCAYLAQAAERSDLLVRLQLSVIRNVIEAQRRQIAMLRDSDVVIA